jgi:hypothetical protein
MKIIIAFFIFCLVLFIYLHINFHIKTSNDLEIFEIDEASKDKLEEICDLRQPVIFDFNNSRILDTSSKTYIYNNYHAFEIKIRDANETDYDNEIYMPLPLHSAVKLFDEDKKSKYFSESNQEFLQDTGVIKNLQYNDTFIRPYMVSNCYYDIIMGSENTTTPFRYELNYRNYFLVTQGSIKIKLTPPKNSKYLYTNYDYENFEFRSPVNPWNVQAKYIADFDKMKCLEITIPAGKTIQIPAYWWYSIKFGKNSSISVFKYRTYMNNAAISPHIIMHALQIQNVKHNIVKKLDIEELNKSTEYSETKTINEKENIDGEENIESDKEKTTNLSNLPEPYSI